MSLYTEFKREFQNLLNAKQRGQVTLHALDLDVRDLDACDMPDRDLPERDFQGRELVIDFDLIETQGVSVQKIKILIPELVRADVKVQQHWANSLCNRLNYLLEKISPIEIDHSTGQVLVRSSQPSSNQSGLDYYEIRLSQGSDGSFEMHRYHVATGQAGRGPVAMQLTHQVLDRLIKDLVETIPVAP